MNDTAIFNRGVSAYFDATKITSDHRTWNNVGVLTNLNISNHIGRFADKG